jgi:hypothetical protein
MGMKILRYDDDLLAAMTDTERETYINTKANYGTIFWKEKLNPMNNWSDGFVTGHKYKIHWGQTGLDFEEMTLTMSKNWIVTDKPIYLVHNYTEVREKIEVKFNGVLV